MSSMADLQRAPGAPQPALPAELPITVERVRTFDTPEFAGMTFLEVEAKSALNRVRGMPFPWSINPYRGCSHACSYCLEGETPILMADGRTRPLADLRPGDAVYGTEVRGASRRYVRTRVLDSWSTVKPAYRVVLADGTELIASGDHRFLSGRGWRHVAGSPEGRPHLEARDRLVGTGAFAEPPKHSEDYQRGYLRGLVRGDGEVDGFWLALRQDQVLDRARDALLAHGVSTDRFVFQQSAAEGGVRAIGTRYRAGVDRIRGLLAWPEQPSDEWRRGLLAGALDAGGGEDLRVPDDDAALVGGISSALRGFGLRPRFDDGALRLSGGLRQHLRLLHLADPAVACGDGIAGHAVEGDASLRVVAIEPLGLDLPLFDLTTGTGDFIADGVVSHNCFARPTHAYLNMSPLGDFERTIVVKTNLVEVLRRELARPSWRGEHVAMGTNTDPYQRAEGRYRLMPGVISALGEALTPFSILTKGTLVTRDIPALQAAAERVPVAAAMTVGMLDEALWRDAEPGTPSPAARLAAVAKLNQAGIPTGVMLAPIMPGLNDDPEQLAALVDAAVRARATYVTPIVLHLRPGVKEAFWPWLTERHPELVDRYRALYRGSQAAKSYADEVLAFVKQQRQAAWERHGRPEAPPVGRWRRPEQRTAVTADPRTGHLEERARDSGGGGQLSLLDTDRP